MFKNCDGLENFFFFFLNTSLQPQWTGQGQLQSSCPLAGQLSQGMFCTAEWRPAALWFYYGAAGRPGAYLKLQTHLSFRVKTKGGYLSCHSDKCFEDKVCITGNVKMSPGEAILQGATLTGIHTYCVEVGVQKEMASKKRRWERHTQRFHWHLVFCLWHCYCCCYLCATKKFLEYYWIMAANRFFFPPSKYTNPNSKYTEHKHISCYELSFYFAWVRHCRVIFSHKSSMALRDGLSAVHYFDSNWNIFKWLNCH